MPTRRVRCEECRKDIRAAKAKGWLEPPVYHYEDELISTTDPKTKKVVTEVKRTRIVDFHGLRPTRYTLCRACYKHKHGTARPIAR